MPKNNNKQHRYAVYVKNNFSCCSCDRTFDIPEGWDQLSAIHDGEMFLEIDHIVPLSKGGSDAVHNKQALCQRCNNHKSNKI